MDLWRRYLRKVLQLLPPTPHPKSTNIKSASIYHWVRKPGQIVFDSSCQNDGVYLNNAFLTGPGLNLVGVLMLFRRETVAITTNIQQMFHCFARPHFRPYLRSFLHQDNDESQDVIAFRIKVHVLATVFLLQLQNMVTDKLQERVKQSLGLRSRYSSRETFMSTMV